MRGNGRDATVALVVPGSAVPGGGDCRDLPADFAEEYPASGEVAAAQRRAGAAGTEAAYRDQSHRSERGVEIILGVPRRWRNRVRASHQPGTPPLPPSPPH